MDECGFCQIIAGKADAYIIFESKDVIAFLDILPERRGHALVVPKKHITLLSDLPDELARAMGSAVTLVSRALIQAIDHDAFTVTLNQIYRQVVPHVHFHIIPAPGLRTSSSTHASVYAQREELDDDVAADLVRDIKARL